MEMDKSVPSPTDIILIRTNGGAITLCVTDLYQQTINSFNDQIYNSNISKNLAV